MTLIELNRYFELVSNLARTKELLDNLRAAAYPASPALTGMPHAPGVKDKVGDLAVEIADLETRKEYIEQENEAQKSIVEEFVQTIDDPYLRTLFRLRFERGLSWKEVAYVLGGGNTEKNVKESCYRYLRK